MESRELRKIGFPTHRLGRRRREAVILKSRNVYIDWLILAPAIPVAPIAITWWLPWERWIPWGRLPKAFLGPYALYLFFVAYHFDDDFRHWWYYIWLAIAGVIVSIMAVIERIEGTKENEATERKAIMLDQAQRWPVAEGLVLHTVQSPDADGDPKVTLRYMYRVHDQEFFGCESATFTNRDDAERFESRCTERKLKVHYQPDKPEICVLDRDALR